MDAAGRVHDHLSQILERVAQDNTVIMAETSCGFLAFAENWAMHVQKLGITNYLMVAADETSVQYLDERYPGHVIPATVFNPENMTSGGFMEFGSKVFNEAMCERLLYQEAVLLRGYHILWTDTDIVWFQNVLDVIPRGFDWVGADDEADGVLSSSQDSKVVCGCLMHWAPTEESKRVMRGWYSKCMEAGVGPDQVSFNQWWTYGDLKQQLRWYILPHQVFPTGGLDLDIDFSNHRQLLPALIHANYREGFEAKREFLQDRHAWLISDQQQFPGCSGTGTSMRHATFHVAG
jgi:rhamnogalacturonan II specific xylosyltransferase